MKQISKVMFGRTKLPANERDDEDKPGVIIFSFVFVLVNKDSFFWVVFKRMSRLGMTEQNFPTQKWAHLKPKFNEI